MGGVPAAEAVSRLPGPPQKIPPQAPLIGNRGACGGIRWAATANGRLKHSGGAAQRRRPTSHPVRRLRDGRATKRSDWRGRRAAPVTLQRPGLRAWHGRAARPQLSGEARRSLRVAAQLAIPLPVVQQVRLELRALGAVRPAQDAFQSCNAAVQLAAFTPSLRRQLHPTRCNVELFCVHACQWTQSLGHLLALYLTPDICAWAHCR
jgi:hypothetical protein